MTRPASSDPEDQSAQDRPLQGESLRGQVLPFRPRHAGKNASSPLPAAVPDLEKYEQTPGETDDFRHRMIMNGLGLAFTAMLVVGGIWIADVMAHMRKDQDCVLIGRPGCTRVDVPLQPR